MPLFKDNISYLYYYRTISILYLLSLYIYTWNCISRFWLNKRLIWYNIIEYFNISFNFPRMSAGITRLKNHSSVLGTSKDPLYYLLFAIYIICYGRVYLTVKIEFKNIDVLCLVVPFVSLYVTLLLWRPSHIKFTPSQVKWDIIVIW